MKLITENRGRAWRRHKLEIFYIRRVKRWTNSSYHWHRFTDVNNIRINTPRWFDYLGLQNIYVLKKTRTRQWNTRVKTKWGKKGKRNYDYSSDPWTRIKDKNNFLRELRNYEY